MYQFHRTETSHVKLSSGTPETPPTPYAFNWSAISWCSTYNVVVNQLAIPCSKYKLNVRSCFSWWNPNNTKPVFFLQNAPTKLAYSRGGNMEEEGTGEEGGDVGKWGERGSEDSPLPTQTLYCRSCCHGGILISLIDYCYQNIINI